MQCHLIPGKIQGRIAVHIDPVPLQRVQRQRRVIRIKGWRSIVSILAYRLGLNVKSGPILEALGYPIILVFSYLFFREPLTKRKILGNLIIICGIVIFHL